MAANKPGGASRERDQALEEIARDVLGIPTLQIRNRDRLDFHDVGVAGLREALRQAWTRGSQAVSASPSARRVCKAIREFAERRYTTDTIPDDLVSILAEADEAITHAEAGAASTQLHKLISAAEALLGARAIEQVVADDWDRLERAVAEAMAWIAPEA